MGATPDRAAPAPGFRHLDARIRLAVESIAATDPNPLDPYRGLYVSDELARSLAREATDDELDGRLHHVARLLGLDAMDTAVLGLVAAPELSPRYGRIYGYLHDDVTRRLASPRLVARLLGDDGIDPLEALSRLGREARLRASGALRMLQADEAVPLADRPARRGARRGGGRRGGPPP
jgi:hypothetical protein